MSAVKRILDRLFPRLGKLTIGGTLTTGSDKTLFPIALANELAGGHHGVNSLSELADIPVDRLVVPMLATVAQNTVNGVTVPTTLYCLTALPSGVDRISDIAGYRITDYWKVLPTKGEPGKQGESIKGDPGKDGSNGITKGIAEYKIATGGSSSYSAMGNFNRGAIIDLEETRARRIKIKGWVNVQMNNYLCSLRLFNSSIFTYSGNTIVQATYHIQDRGNVVQWHIDGYIETSDRYIGLTFSDSMSTGQLVSTFGLELFILD